MRLPGSKGWPSGLPCAARGAHRILLASTSRGWIKHMCTLCRDTEALWTYVPQIMGKHRGLPPPDSCGHDLLPEYRGASSLSMVLMSCWRPGGLLPRAGQASTVTMMLLEERILQATI